MSGAGQTVHRRVYRGRGPALAVQAVVEEVDHLVFVILAAIDIPESTQAIETEHGQSGIGQGAQITARALDPQQVDRLARDGSAFVPLADVFPPA